MIYREFVFDGVIAPAMLAATLAAFCIAMALRKFLSRLGWREAAWNPPLLDLALFALVLSGVFALLQGFS